MGTEFSSQGCPKCGQKFIVGQASCSSCGLVFSKWEQKQVGLNLQGSERMELAWQEVLNRWNEDPAHRKFIDQCQREHNLPFASLKYRRVLESDPHSEMALKMQKFIQQIILASFMTASPVPEEKPYSGKAIYMFLIIAALMIVMGLNLPGQFISSGMPLILVGIFAFIAVFILKRRFL